MGLEVADANRPAKATNCPGCRQVVKFYVTGAPGSDEWVWMHPDPPGTVQLRGDVIEALQDQNALLAEAYAEAVANVVDQRWSSALVQTRRTLEGVVRSVLSTKDDDHAPLGNLLKLLANFDGLGDPLVATAEAVKDGGNLGSHLDLRKPADARLARDALELLEALVQYLLILPARVKALRDHIEGPGPDAPRGGSADAE
ncbi:MAG: DUF4145 domain-containing protein [Actinobacteria bacterium]|nr:DUF4145 domain-containing protein [Actinomycetota bacterium]